MGSGSVGSVRGFMKAYKDMSAAEVRAILERTVESLVEAAKYSDKNLSEIKEFLDGLDLPGMPEISLEREWSVSLTINVSAMDEDSAMEKVEDILYRNESVLDYDVSYAEAVE